MSLRRASVLVVLALSLGGAVAFTQLNPLQPQAIAQNRGESDRPDKGMPRWIQDLNLTPEQTQQMQAIRDRYKDQMTQRAQALRQAQRELGDLMAGDASKDQIRTKYNQVQTLKQQLGQVRFESMLEMRDVLTSEQRRQMAERMKNRRENFGNRMRDNRDSQQ